MSDYSEAFAEVKRAVQPDVDPKLTFGDGETPDPEAELDTIILATARAAVWTSGLVVKYGDIIVPTVGNGRKYRVTAPGALGSSEPTWPGEFGSVTTNGVTLEEDGYFKGSIYDTRAAIRKCAQVMLSKTREYTGKDESRIPERLERLIRDYAPVGIA